MAILYRLGDKTILIDKLDNNLTSREDRELRVTPQLEGHDSSRCPATRFIYPYSQKFGPGCWR